MQKIFNDPKKEILYLLEFGLRVYTAAMMFIYGAAKPMQFSANAHLEKTVEELSKSELMWVFFGATQFYPIFIGVIEMVGAILLCFRKTKVIGAVILVPVLVNIVVMDVLYEINTGALANAIVFLLVCCFVLYQERLRLKVAISKLILPVTNEKADLKALIIRNGIALLLGVLFYFLSASIVSIFIKTFLR